MFGFALFKYFPFGGLQRDFLRIALECQKQGHDVQVYTTSWQGDEPEGFDIQLISVKGSSNHIRMLDFQNRIQNTLTNSPVDLLIGFNKMAGLDIYYAADICFKDKALKSRGWWYRLTSRYKHYVTFEEAVFSTTSNTVALLISQLQKPIFQHHYQTPDARIKLLPPGISKDRCRPENADKIRQSFRQEFNINDDEKLILMIGSGFKTKGLDRAIKAVAALPEALKEKTRFFIIGQDKKKSFVSLAKELGVETHIHFLAGRDDVPRFLLGADLLIHPAYNENTGTVLLEALVAGLPVLTTDVCGYAHHILDANAGKVVSSPFSQNELNTLTHAMLSSDQQTEWLDNAVAYSKRADLYSMPEKVADIIIRQSKSKLSAMVNQ